MTPPDSQQQGDDPRMEAISLAAYHIDKCCTGGTDEDWTAAEMIVEDLVDPLEAEVERLRTLTEGDTTSIYWEAAQYRLVLQAIVRDSPDSDAWSRAAARSVLSAVEAAALTGEQA